MSTEKLNEKIERPHHPFGPSKLQNIEACPCYESRSGGSLAATLGTKQHNVAETGDDDHTLTDDHAAAVAECMDFFARQKQLMIEARDRDVFESVNTAHAIDSHTSVERLREIAESEVDPVQEFNEIYLSIDSRIHSVPAWSEKECKFVEQRLETTTGGYIDKAIISHDGFYAEVFDWKFGKWPVEDAANNVQGIAYVLGFFKMFPLVERVKMWFKQPHINVITSQVFVRLDVPALSLRIKTIVGRKVEANRKGDFSMANPMVPVCNFCAQIGRCPKVAAFACNVAHKFHPMAVPADITPSALHDAKDAGIGMRLAGVLTVWCDAYKKQASDQVMRGAAPIPEGYALATRSDRGIADKAKFIAVSRRYVTEAELAEAADYTFGKLEETISDKAPRGQKKATLDEYKKALEDGGAVVKGPEYSFLRAAAKRKDEV